MKRVSCPPERTLPRSLQVGNPDVNFQLVQCSSSKRSEILVYLLESNLLPAIHKFTISSSMATARRHHSNQPHRRPARCPHSARSLSGRTGESSCRRLQERHFVKVGRGAQRHSGHGKQISRKQRINAQEVLRRLSSTAPGDIVWISTPILTGVREFRRLEPVRKLDAVLMAATDLLSGF